MKKLPTIIEVDADAGSRVLEIRLTGQLEKSDYEELVPLVETKIREQGVIRILVRLEDFAGWSAGGVWEDIKFDIRHFSDIERVAIVGETKWERGMAVFCRPFTGAKVRYFDHARLKEAREWINEGTE